MFRFDSSSQLGNRGFWDRMRNHPTVSAINQFMRTPWYVLLIAVLTAISNGFALDLYLYTLLIAISVYISLLSIDFLPMMPIAICCYVSPSTANNPGRNPDSIFYPENGGIYLIVLVSIFVASLIFRLVTDPDFGGMNFLKAKRSLAGGMILLGIAYLISGIGADGYTEIALNNLLFALIQFAAIFLLYYLFTGGVKWDRVPKDYLAWTGMCVGLVVLVQLLENYLSGRIFIDSSMTIDRYEISTGWGMHNNVGAMMAMMLPFAFYLARGQKLSWLYNAIGTLLMMGVILSCSRTSMMVAAVAYLICVIILLVDRSTRRYSLRVLLVTIAVVAAGAFLFRDALASIFDKFFDEITNISSRDKIYINGLKQFLNDPVFGGSFYPREFVPWDWSDVDAFSSFFPPRWHNTIVQIAASCGVVGLAAYGFHRYQTVKLLVKGFSYEKLFVALFIGVLLATSMLDCHFFNVGPVLFYSMALAFAEKIHESKI